jgi:hypothetical protein
MRRPKRPVAHLTQTKSWRVLESVAPDEWILREVSERDYGIDAYIELVSTDNEVTGYLVSVQLKGAEKMDWRQAPGRGLIARSPSVKTSTAVYWMNIQVPVFLFVADLSASEVYFVSVQEHIRSQVDKLATQDSITFEIDQHLSVRTDHGRRLFRWFYARERLHEQFAFHIANLLNQAAGFADFIVSNQGRDRFMEVEAERHLQFRAVYESCRMASLYFDHEWSAETLDQLYEKDRSEFASDLVELHEQTLDYALQKLEKLFPVLVRKAIALIAKKERHYWNDRDPTLVRLCGSGELEGIIQNSEREAGR